MRRKLMDQDAARCFARRRTTNNAQPFLYAARMEQGVVHLEGHFDEQLDIWVVEVDGALGPLVYAGSVLARTQTVTFVKGEASDED
ncbi:MAG: hypothetical protein M3082_14910 [Candidatus Dormibacteraeota bacterium]|nr:hypothetical protein [Candidatus Dormibacteraeota bacterium]